MAEQRRDSFTDFLVAKGRKDGIVSLDSDYGLGTADVIEACGGLTAKQADACLRAAKKILRTDPRDAEIARLRAELAAVADAMHGPTLQPLAERVRGYVETCDRLGREKAEALADNAVLRRRAIQCGDCVLCRGTAERHDEDCPCFSPHPGAGMVVLPREVVERVRSALREAEDQMCAVPPRGHGCVCNCPVIDGHTSACVVVRAIADLDALLKKGGG